LAREAREPLTVCIWDLDRFKQVNDQHGHQIGDQVLVQFADTLRARIRRTDFVARIGGDEFIIAMPHTAAARAKEIAAMIQLSFAQTQFAGEASSFSVSASFGIAEMASSHGEPKDLVAEADRHLYHAKRARALVEA
ncbi:MAG: hypothetical protein JWN34_103, partial [Bryobacterales bacterium]|nr:hypothetical protein [Bryobacterales bacterium]